MLGDTIAAIATPLGTGGIGIVRLSGPEALAILRRVFRPARPKEDFPSHTVTYGHIVDPQNGAVLDEVLVTVMRAPRSYTREDVVEINCHGGIVPLRETLALVLREGARLAAPGEFTKRAFLNGRIDLAQAEAVLEVVGARTKEALAAALAQARGELSARIKSLRAAILEVVAALEASVDFPEEVPPPAEEELRAALSRWQEEISTLLAAAERGKIFREGIAVVIAGKPNAGKSSLLNALLQEKRALVTEIPGTTRDVIEESLDLGGIPLRLLDTAGIRETGDPVERLGVERAWEAIKEANLVLLLLDATTPLDACEKELLKFLRERARLVCINKVDVASPKALEALTADVKEHLGEEEEVLRISAKQGTGLAQLEAKIREKFLGGEVAPRGEVFLLHLHQREALLRAQRSLEEVEKTLAAFSFPEFLLVDLREALEALGEVTGETVTEEILEKIFANFCVGK